MHTTQANDPLGLFDHWHLTGAPPEPIDGLTLANMRLSAAAEIADALGHDLGQTDGQEQEARWLAAALAAQAIVTLSGETG